MAKILHFSDDVVPTGGPFPVCGAQVPYYLLEAEQAANASTLLQSDWSISWQAFYGEGLSIQPGIWTAFVWAGVWSTPPKAPWITVRVRILDSTCIQTPDSNILEQQIEGVALNISQQYSVSVDMPTSRFVPANGWLVVEIKQDTQLTDPVRVDYNGAGSVTGRDGFNSRLSYPGSTEPIELSFSTTDSESVAVHKGMHPKFTISDNVDSPIMGHSVTSGAKEINTHIIDDEPDQTLTHITGGHHILIDDDTETLTLGMERRTRILLPAATENIIFSQQLTSTYEFDVVDVDSPWMWHTVDRFGVTVTLPLGTTDSDAPSFHMIRHPLIRIDDSESADMTIVVHRWLDLIVHTIDTDENIVMTHRLQPLLLSTTDSDNAVMTFNTDSADAVNWTVESPITKQESTDSPI